MPDKWTYAVFQLQSFNSHILTDTIKFCYKFAYFIIYTRSKEMGFVSKWKFSTQTAIFQDCLHVKTKIINHKSQSSPIDGLRFMDICPQKSLLDLTPSGIFAQWNNFWGFLGITTENLAKICQWKKALH